MNALVQDRPRAAVHAVDAHGSLKGYLVGFGLSVVLTAIPFWLVMNGTLPSQATGLVVVACAAVQIVVHMVFFLHLNGKAEGGWTLLALMFTVIVVGITLSGSLWVIYHLNANMMSTQAMGEIP